MTCIPVDLVGQYDRDRYTVIFEYGPTGTINISSTSPNMRYYEGSLRLQALNENPDSQDIGRYAKNTWVSLKQTGTESARLDIDLGFNNHAYEVADGAFEHSGFEEYEHGTQFLHDRMVQIASGNKDWYTPQDCKSKYDIRDHFEQFTPEDFGSHTLGTPVDGALDHGNDIDLYELRLQSGIAYGIKVKGVDHSEVSGRYVELNTDVKSKKLRDIQPVIRILDQDGNELATAMNDEIVAIQAPTTGTYYVEVGRPNQTRPEYRRAGVYQLSMEHAAELEDLPGNASTIARIAPGNSLNSSFDSYTDDIDWVRLEVEARTTYTITVTGSDARGTPKPVDQLALEVLEPNGVPAPENKTGFGRAGNYQIAEFKPPAGNTRYYVSVISLDGLAGDYTLSLHESDGYKAFIGRPPATLDADNPVSGTLETAWDSDRFNMTLTDGHNHIVKVVDSNGQPLDGMDITVDYTDDPSGAYDDKYLNLIGNGNGKFAVQLVEGGLTGKPEESGDVSMTINIQNAPSSHSVVDYQMSVKTGQYQNVSGSDDHPDTTPNRTMSTINVSELGEAAAHGKLNGDGDEDMFIVGNWPAGDYQLTWQVNKEHGVNGMRIKVYDAGGRYLRDLTTDTVYNVGDTFGEQPDGISYNRIAVTNWNPDTTLGYSLFINRVNP